MAVDAIAIPRGSVVLVRLPRDKARPAVVVRSDLLSGLSYATVLPITSGLRADISLRIDLAPTRENGLRAASQVMTDWPQTVRLSEVGEVIGRVDPATMRAITRQMAICVGYRLRRQNPTRLTCHGGSSKPKPSLRPHRPARIASLPQSVPRIGLSAGWSGMPSPAAGAGP